MGKRVSLPAEVVALLLVTMASSIVFTVAGAMTEYAFIKPYVANIVFKEPNLKTEGCVLNFDPESLKYPSAQVQVKNYGSEAASAAIYIYLFDGNGIIVATGQNTVNANPDSTVTVTVTLSWSTGKNATHVGSARVTVKE